MSEKKFIFYTILIIATMGVFVIFISTRESNEDRPLRQDALEERAPESALKEKPSAEQTSHQPRGARSYFREYGSDRGSIEQDLLILDKTFGAFWMLMKNPDMLRLDSNASIMKTLTGDNVEGFAFIDKDSPFISESGELLDRWGTPLAFHPISVANIETRSAGPDKTFYTEDDTVLAITGGPMRPRDHSAPI